MYSNNGRVPTGLKPRDLALTATSAGAGEILINSIDFDGAMKGFDINAKKARTDAANIPVIATGGDSEPSRFVKVVKKARVSAVAAGSIFFFRSLTLLMVKKNYAEVGH